MVTTELATIWITSDGKKFLNKREAILHEKLEGGKWDKDEEEDLSDSDSETDEETMKWLRDNFMRFP